MICTQLHIPTASPLTLLHILNTLLLCSSLFIILFSLRIVAEIRGECDVYQSYKRKSEHWKPEGMPTVRSA